MEQKLELIYMGAAAFLFVIAMSVWMNMEMQMNENLVLLEQQFNEERVITRTGGW